MTFNEMLDGEQFDIVIPQRKVNKALIGIIAKDMGVSAFRAEEILQKSNTKELNEKYRKQLRNVLSSQIKRELDEWREYFKKVKEIGNEN